MKKFNATLHKYAQQKPIRIGLIALAILIPLILVLTSLARGYLALWYDPARDLLSAWSNLQKPTLIGPTSGIPGIFYGPYWIWLLSIGQILSKNPIVVTFITATLPYFILFSLLWFRLSSYFGLKASILGWLFFMLSTGMTYASQLWNPHPAPLLAFIVLFLLFMNGFKELSKRSLFFAILTGFVLGLVINFHISFGIGFTAGVGLYLLISTFIGVRQAKKSVKKMLAVKLLFILAIGFGFFVAFLPTLLFEVRHGFNQVQTLLATLSQFGDVVAVKGLSKPLIFQEFIETFGKLLHVPYIFAGVILFLSTLAYAILVALKKIRLTAQDKKFLLLICSVLSGIAFIYFTARNPVWEYHFIGVEIFFLLVLTFFLAKIPYYYLAGFAGVTAITIAAYFTYFVTDANKGVTDFYAKKQVVQTIVSDAGSNDYTVYAFSPSIYSYEYSYLFKWVANKDVPYDPGANNVTDTLYVILPTKTSTQALEFEKFRASEEKFKTVKAWQVGKDIKIVKKEAR